MYNRYEEATHTGTICECADVINLKEETNYGY